jgi:hypothetical protein
LQGLEKKQVLLKKLAGRLNTGFSQVSRFFSQNRLFNAIVHILGSRSVKMQLPVKYATTMKTDQDESNF